MSGAKPEPWKGSTIPTKALSTQAKTSGKFSDPELDKLWRELLHHREKMREYNVLLEALSREEGEPCAMRVQEPSRRGRVDEGQAPNFRLPSSVGDHGLQVPQRCSLHMTGSLM